MTDRWLLDLADRLDPEPNRYLAAPVEWIEDRLGEHVTRHQAEIADAITRHRYVAVRSCHAVGKSFTASRVVSWWLDVHPPGEAFVVTTAPTSAQVSAILWREIGRAHRQGQLKGYVTGADEWKLTHDDGPAELIAYGRKPADYEPTAFQGIHARFVLVVIDEACGVPRALYNAVDSLATNEAARVLAIGNPDDPASHFAEVCKLGSGWHVIGIDALRSPNFTLDQLLPHPELLDYMAAEGVEPTDEVIPEHLRDLLVSPTWVAERIARWGVDNPLFASKVRGRFPSVTLDTLIQPHWVELAKARDLPHSPTQGRLGVDVARYGSDKSIILLRETGWCRVVREVGRGPVTELAGMVQDVGRDQVRRGGHLPMACVDDTGVGGGVTDILAEDGYPVTPIVAGGRPVGDDLLPNGKPRFGNLRSQLWWNMRDALAGRSGTGDDGWLDLDPDDIELHAQLLAPRYKINRHGQVEVETKDSLKARGLDSPDRADALTYALAPVKAMADVVVRPDQLITSDLLAMTGW